MESKDLRFLKKHYGEEFAHLCRSLFPTVLEKEGLLSEVISSHFGKSHLLYNDIVSDPSNLENFTNFILNCAELNKNQARPSAKKTPEELMDEAGYILFPECKTEEEIQAFKKYYREGEELCTFRGGRLYSNRVWFAVKKNVDEIRRADFHTPRRQDEYGTSVISLQFTRGRNSTLSIKNRYNHTVENPDATFGNDLDNIIPGLTMAFITNYHINLVNDAKNFFYLSGYRLANDGKFYRENIEDDNISYCENNIIVNFNGEVVEFDKARYILAEKYVIDKQKNTIEKYPKDSSDSFINSIGEIESISTRTDEDGNKVVVVKPKEGENVELTLGRDNSILGYSNPNATEIGDDFLCSNRNIKKLSLPKVKKIGKDFMTYNRGLTSLSLPEVEYISPGFLYENRILAEFSAPKLIQTSYFLTHNQNITELSLPSLTSAGDGFLNNNEILKQLYAPNLIDIGNHFLQNNKRLTKLSLPCLNSIGNCFLSRNKCLKNLYAPNLAFIGDAFLDGNKCLTELSLPNLEKVCDNFLASNEKLKELYAPKLSVVCSNFLFGNKDLTELSLPSIESVGDKFLYRNQNLNQIFVPKLREVGKEFMHNNVCLTELSLPSLEKVWDYFLENNEILQQLYAPKLKRVGFSFLVFNKNLEELSLPSLERTSIGFLRYNKILKKLYAPKLREVSYEFLYNNKELTELSLPSLESASALFLEKNEKLKKFYAPKLKNRPGKFCNVTSGSEEEKDK